MDVRYEDFVAEPQETMGHILDFLGLEWTPAFGSGFRRYRFDPSRNDAYRTDLGIHDVSLLDAALCPLLQRYAYVEPQRRKSEGSSPAVEGG
jgi:hypothetical protein